MSVPPTNSKSVHGFSSLTRGTQVSLAEPKLDVKSERTASPSAETLPVVNRAVASRSTRHPRLSFSSFAPSSDKPVEEYQKGARNEQPKENQQQVKDQVPVSGTEVNGKEGEEEEEEEEVKRTWNLRPRKAYGGSKRSRGVLASETSAGGATEMKHHKSGGGIEPKSNRQRGIPAESPGLGGVEGTNENHRLWIALSRDEIEEDMFSMSGNRPSRRPRKRAKALQKYLDVIFPGLCLVGMNADCFKVPNTPVKGR